MRSSPNPHQDFHEALAHWNRVRLAPGRGDGDWREALASDHAMSFQETSWVESERAAIQAQALTAPTEPGDFLQWFDQLKATGPGQGHRLFPWLAQEASLPQLRWFIEQEVAGEAGFDDLTALAQIKLPTRPKLEVARNYWDEMGRGREAGMHGPMLEHLARALDARVTIESTVWESLALGNMMVALAANRRYAVQALGALGAVELTAPTRAPFVVDGLKRLGFGLDVHRYFSLHAVLDVKHSEAWNREVLEPLVEEDPLNAFALAEGALLRLRAGERCFERYEAELAQGTASARVGDATSAPGEASRMAS